MNGPAAKRWKAGEQKVLTSILTATKQYNRHLVCCTKQQQQHKLTTMMMSGLTNCCNFVGAKISSIWLHSFLFFFFFQIQCQKGKGNNCLLLFKFLTQKVANVWKCLCSHVYDTTKTTTIMERIYFCLVYISLLRKKYLRLAKDNVSPGQNQQHN